MHTLIIILVLFILLSGFFSGSETGMMSLNRYRLRHLARKKHRAAMRASKLLERPDRLLGVILIGNTFANVLASSLATLIAVRLFGDMGILVATIVLTLVILIFAEITPKTIAASYPEKVAFLTALPLQVLLKICYPIVWLVNTFVNGMFRLFHLKVKSRVVEPLTYDELQTVVYESSGKITQRHQEMLLRILELRNISVDDVMIPRSDIVGIDINDSWGEVLQQLAKIKHAHILVYRDSIESVVGVLHLHGIIKLMVQDRLTKKTIMRVIEEVYFIPEATPLTMQLLNFQQRQTAMALVVDEYGDIQGLVTVEDILEEIVGEFASEAVSGNDEIVSEEGGSFLIDAGINIRDLNREMQWHFPINGPKTLSGLIVERLETLPKVGVGIKIVGYPIDILVAEGNMVKKVRVGARISDE